METTESFICNYCGKALANKYNLRNHQARTKSCLDKQRHMNMKVKEDLSQCKFCSDKYDPTTMSRHLLSCKMKAVHEVRIRDNEIVELKTKVNNLETALKAAKCEIEVLKRYSVTNRLINNTAEKVLARDVKDVIHEISTSGTTASTTPVQQPVTIDKISSFKSTLTNGNEIRVLGTYDKPLFIARDIAEMLGYKDTVNAIKDHVDNYDKITWKEADKARAGVSPPLKIQPQTQLINESGLYSLILRSKLPHAKEFKRWVTSEVLPSIRKSGEYKTQKLEEQLHLKTLELNQITIKHNMLLKRRKRHIYEKGNVVYILSHDFVDNNVTSVCYKVGKATQKTKESVSAFTTRLSSYNTHMPTEFKVRYFIYLDNNSLIENMLKEKYKNTLYQVNREWIQGIDIKDIIAFIRSQCEVLGIKYQDREIMNSHKSTEIDPTFESDSE